MIEQKPWPFPTWESEQAKQNRRSFISRFFTPTPLAACDSIFEKWKLKYSQQSTLKRDAFSKDIDD